MLKTDLTDSAEKCQPGDNEMNRVTGNRILPAPKSSRPTLPSLTQAADSSSANRMPLSRSRDAGPPGAYLLSLSPCPASSALGSVTASRNRPRYSASPCLATHRIWRTLHLIQRPNPGW